MSLRSQGWRGPRRCVRRRIVVRFSDASGSATVLIVGVVAAMAIGVSVLGAAVRIQVDLVRAATSADSAAVAGAAATVGLVAGPPCSAASAVATASGARLDSCSVDGAAVTVRAVVRSGVFAVGATSRAGPDERSAICREGSDGGASGTVCMVCLSVRQRPTPPVVRRDLRPATVCTIDQGVTCQARRSS